jgi:hypothetical protein
MLVDTFKSGTNLPERKVTDPESIPPLAELAATGKMAKGAKA